MGRPGKSSSGKVVPKKAAKEKIVLKNKATKQHHKENIKNEARAPTVCLEEEIDRSQVNFPFDVRISSLKALMKTVEKATTKV